jgi:hypothetical protein
MIVFLSPVKGEKRVRKKEASAPRRAADRRAMTLL